MDQTLDLGNDNAVRLRSIEDLSDTRVCFGDYIRLRGLSVGDIIYLKNDGSGEKVIFVGNGSPYEGVSSVSHDGWDFKTYNMWIVDRVFRLNLEANGAFLTPGEKLMADEIAHKP